MRLSNPMRLLAVTSVSRPIPSSWAVPRWARPLNTDASITALSNKNLELAKGILVGDRSCLARGITLMESSRSDHRVQADMLQQYLLRNRVLHRKQWKSSSFRIGVAGPPGAGNSVTMSI